MKNICNEEKCGREFETRVTVNGTEMYCPACASQNNWGFAMGLILCALISIITFVIYRFVQ